MLENLKEIAQQIANSRTRLSHPFEDKQNRQTIIDEAKRMEAIEISLRREITNMENILKDLLGVV
jgi:hypothetical protein